MDTLVSPAAHPQVCHRVCQSVAALRPRLAPGISGPMSSSSKPSLYDTLVTPLRLYGDFAEAVADYMAEAARWITRAVLKGGLVVAFGAAWIGGLIFLARWLLT